jgi:hypothetical protein
MAAGEPQQHHEHTRDGRSRLLLEIPEELA